jgi:hypothetical protein
VEMSSLSVLGGLRWSAQRLVMGLQIVQLCPNRLLRCRPQAAVNVGVHPGNNITRRTVPCRERGSYLIESLVPVFAIKGQPSLRLGNDRPVTRKQLNNAASGD